MRTNRTKKLLKDGNDAFGLWAQSGSPAVVEAASTLDLDWILLDFEHGFGSAHDVLALADIIVTSLADLEAELVARGRLG